MYKVGTIIFLSEWKIQKRIFSFYAPISAQDMILKGVQFVNLFWAVHVGDTLANFSELI
jgi:hypothetical protein